MPMDSILDYLRRCGGKDVLVFDTAEAASRARDLLIHQLEEDSLAFDLFPSIDQFDTELRLRLKEPARVKSTQQAKAIF